MDYQKFISCLLAELQDLYGKDAQITTRKMLKNNRQYYIGLQILRKAGRDTIPVINLDEIYGEYSRGDMDFEDCIKKISRLREEYVCPEDIMQFADSLLYWEKVRKKVYPILLSTKENQQLLEELVSVPLLDLSVAYIIRGEEGKSVKINKAILKSYGIDSQELHRQAIENMKQDGYRFIDMEKLLADMLHEMGIEDIPLPEGLRPGKMFILSNAARIYGAAGILDKELIREFTGNRDFFILPSSIHETIFVAPDAVRKDSGELDKLVEEVNNSVVSKEEKLSDHSYFYDAKEDEIRIYA